MRWNTIRKGPWCGILTIFSVVWVVSLIYLMLSGSSNRTAEEYHGWVASELVIQHMETNGGAWPQDWDGLRPFYKTDPLNPSKPDQFEELTRRVDIDWSVDPKQLKAELAKNSHPTPMLIKLIDGSFSKWEDVEPNDLIAKYLTAGERYPPPGY